MNFSFLSYVLFFFQQFMLNINLKFHMILIFSTTITILLCNINNIQLTNLGANQPALHNGVASTSQRPTTNKPLSRSEQVLNSMNNKSEPHLYMRPRHYQNGSINSVNNSNSNVHASSSHTNGALLNGGPSDKSAEPRVYSSRRLPGRGERSTTSGSAQRAATSQYAPPPPPLPTVTPTRVAHNSPPTKDTSTPQRR